MGNGRKNSLMHSKVQVVALSLSGLLTPSLAKAVTWDAQAERLQLVSASLLDAQPLLSPKQQTSDSGGFRIEGKAVVSVLPKMNATVGGKSEQPPQPPAHSIPTAEASYESPKTKIGRGLVRAWAGMLPASAAKSTGMKASCEQKINGLSLGLKADNTNFIDIALEVGQQWASTKVKGGITEPDSQDEFLVRSRLRFATLTMKLVDFPSLWFQTQIAERDVALHFEIPADGTVFDLQDESTVKEGSAATQATIGYDVGKGVQVAAGYLNVPHRVSMPRFLLSYSVATGDQGHRVAQRD